MTVKKCTKSVVLLIKPNCFFDVLVAAAVVGPQDGVTSQKNVCVGGYRVSDPKVPITNNNNNKLYLHDHNKVLQYCKSYLKLLIDSL